jgi:hypothetical protein
MSILCWNCRGLGNQRAVRDLHQMVKEKRPSLVFLMETKLYYNKADFLRIKMNFDYMFVVDCVGRSSGLILLWNEKINVVIQNYSRRHINAIVNLGKDGLPWKFSGFYGHPVAAKRHESWELLRHLCNLEPMPWLCVGDFNEIVNFSEIKGTTSRNRRQMEDFQRALEDCQLCDLGFKGSKYTWNNGREGDAFTQERLDRAVANSEWRMKFVDVEVLVMARRSSDHHPLLLLLKNEQVTGRRRLRPFRMENRWAKRADFTDTIRATWKVRRESRCPWAEIKENMQRCKKTIQIWVKKSVHAPDNLIKEKTCALEKIQGEEGVRDSEKEDELKLEIQNLMEQEEATWKQRAKEDWLRGGDRNTRYFYACATQKKKRSVMERIQDEAGREYSLPEDIEGAFISYYSQLFTSTRPRNIECCTSSLNCIVSEEMNTKLTAIFMVEEIKMALDQMAPCKAPGPDGFIADFYQQQWTTVGNEVCEAALYFLNTAQMDEAINVTNIALIPKVKDPKCVTDFRPISLCNVLYKIISKVLANRLKTILPMVISQNQSAFLPGRLITDNILAAYETLHTMHTRLWSKVGYMGIKLDMSKAYDRVEWEFLDAVMEKMGFSSRWRMLIMACVRTVTYSVVVNGQPVGNIKPSRGL